MTDPETQTQDHQEDKLQVQAEEQDRQHRELVAALKRELGLAD